MSSGIRNKNHLKSGSDKNKRRRSRDCETNIHHIIPRSRGGGEDNSNKVRIPRRIHELYHNLFSNMTPSEVLSFLENCIWDGDTSIIDDYAEKGRE